MILKKSKIPKGWKEIKLRTLCSKIGSGSTPRGGEKVYLKSGVSFLRSQNIQNGFLNFSDIAYISNETHQKMSSSQVLENDVLFNITGASIGRTAVYKNLKAANVNQHVCIIRLKNDDPRFVNLFLQSHSGIKELYSFQAGGNREGLNFQQLGSFKLLLPSLSEQKRIVEVLHTWDTCLQKLDQKIKIKKQIKKGLMQKLLTGEVRLKEFSNKWKKVKLIDVGTFSKGKEISKAQLSDKGYNAIRYGELYTRHHIVIKKIYSFISKNIANISKKISTGDILFAASGETIDEIGKSAVYLGNLPCYASGDTIVFSANNQDSLFLAYLLNSHISRKELRKLGQGQSVVHIYKKDLEKLRINIPPLLEQNSISNILITSDEEISKLKKKRDIIADQKKYLLNKLVTGELRLPEFRN